MKRALKALRWPLLLLLVFGIGSGLIAQQTPKVHAAVMQQIAAAGLAQQQQTSFQPGWLYAHSAGQLQLAQQLCRDCEPLRYSGELKQGLGALFAGELALVSMDYQIQLPSFALEPSLPPLSLSAQQSTDLQAQLQLPASEHRYNNGRHSYRIQQTGIAAQIQKQRLHSAAPSLSLGRDANTWLNLDQLNLEATINEELELALNAEAFKVPIWAWQGENPQLQYRHTSQARQLELEARLNIPSSQTAQQQHGASAADLQIENLDWPSTQEFIRQLPPLMSDTSSAAARMFGLLSLYSLHGPAFFASAPTLALNAKQLPIGDTGADFKIDLAITPGIKRPPMHPREWQNALQGRVDVTAPAEYLQAWWKSSARLVNMITGLPRDYANLRSMGWVQVQADGRHRLFFTMNPTQGLQQAS